MFGRNSSPEVDYGMDSAAQPWIFGGLAINAGGWALFGLGSLVEAVTGSESVVQEAGLAVFLVGMVPLAIGSVIEVIKMPNAERVDHGFTGRTAEG